MTRYSLVLLAVAALAALAQAPRPVFEVASVKPVPFDNAATAPVQVANIDDGGVRLRQPLQRLVCMAYRVRADQVAAPSWMARTWFDVDAKLPAGATRDQIPEMLQDLLAARFQMAVHREQREKPVYALVVAKGGLRMKPKPLDAGTPPTPSCASNLFDRSGGTVIAGDRKSVLGPEGSRMEMTRISTLVDVATAFTDRPVIDNTNLSGGYDIKLDLPFTQGRTSDPVGSIDPVLVAALDKLGLKLESQKAPIETIVVDHVLPNPSEN